MAQGATSEPLMIVCSKFPRRRGGTVTQAMWSWAAQRRRPSRPRLLVTLPRAASCSCGAWRISPSPRQHPARGAIFTCALRSYLPPREKA